MDSSDGALLAAIRETGDASAYAELYRRHVDAARAATYRIAPNLDKDDVISEAFTRILQAINNGSGPTDLFRPYLYQTIRRVSIDLSQAQHLDIDDQDELADPHTFNDLADAIADRDLVSTALSDMPERWQAVLWYTEVEGYTPAAAAALVGTSANNVAQIRSRARKRLRAQITNLTPPVAGQRDLALGRRIAVVLLGSTTAGALMPLFEDEKTRAAAAVGLTGAALFGSKALIAGGGTLLAGLIAVAILLLTQQEAPVTPAAPPTQSPTPSPSAGPTPSPTPRQEPEDEEEDQPVTEDPGEETTRTPVNPGPWGELPRFPPVIRAPEDR